MKTIAPLQIISKRLLLDQFEMKDAQSFFAYRSSPQICKYQSWEPKTEEEVEGFIKNQLELKINEPGSWYQFALRLNRDLSTLIGDCAIHFPKDDKYQAEVGVTVAPRYQGFGYGREALVTMVDYLFSNLNKHRVYASVDPDNEASINMLEKIGFRKEGHFVKSLQIKDQWVDDVIYAMLKEEWGE